MSLERTPTIPGINETSSNDEVMLAILTQILNIANDPDQLTALFMRRGYNGNSYNGPTNPSLFGETKEASATQEAWKNWLFSDAATDSPAGIDSRTHTEKWIQPKLADETQEDWIKAAKSSLLLEAILDEFPSAYYLQLTNPVLNKLENDPSYLLTSEDQSTLSAALSKKELLKENLGAIFEEFKRQPLEIPFTENSPVVQKLQAIRLKLAAQANLAALIDAPGLKKSPVNIAYVSNPSTEAKVVVDWTRMRPNSKGQPRCIINGKELSTYPSAQAFLQATTLPEKISTLETFFEEVLLSELDATFSEEKKEEISAYLMENFHQGSLLNPVSAPLNLYINAQEPIPGNSTVKINTQNPPRCLHIITTSHGFQLTETVTVKELSIASNKIIDDPQILAKQPDKPLIESIGTIAVDFSASTQQPTVTVEANKLRCNPSDITEKLSIGRDVEDIIFPKPLTDVEKIQIQLFLKESEAHLKELEADMIREIIRYSQSKNISSEQQQKMKEVLFRSASIYNKDKSLLVKDLLAAPPNMSKGFKENLIAFSPEMGVLLEKHAAMTETKNSLSKVKFRGDLLDVAHKAEQNRTVFEKHRDNRALQIIGGIIQYCRDLFHYAGKTASREKRSLSESFKPKSARLLGDLKKISQTETDENTPSNNHTPAPRGR